MYVLNKNLTKNDLNVWHFLILGFYNESDRILIENFVAYLFSANTVEIGLIAYNYDLKVLHCFIRTFKVNVN